MPEAVELDRPDSSSLDDLPELPLAHVVHLERVA
jgi:hypothetical protein